MEEQLVSFKTAMLAKEKGFNILVKPTTTMNNLDWGKSTAERNTNLDKYNSLKTDKEKDTFKRKLKGESVNESNVSKRRAGAELKADIGYANSDISHDIMAPTQTLLQKWLREVCDINVEVVSKKYQIKELSFLPRTFRYVLEDQYSKESYNSYEEALEKGLEEALKD
jgi:hypothetical protein